MRKFFNFLFKSKNRPFSIFILASGQLVASPQKVNFSKSRFWLLIGFRIFQNEYFQNLKKHIPHNLWSKFQKNSTAIPENASRYALSFGSTYPRTLPYRRPVTNTIHHLTPYGVKKVTSFPLLGSKDPGPGSEKSPANIETKILFKFLVGLRNIHFLDNFHLLRSTKNRWTWLDYA